VAQRANILWLCFIPELRHPLPQSFQVQLNYGHTGWINKSDVVDRLRGDLKTKNVSIILQNTQAGLRAIKNPFPEGKGFIDEHLKNESLWLLL
jgi:hypothetical protein